MQYCLLFYYSSILPSKISTIYAANFYDISQQYKVKWQKFKLLLKYLSQVKDIISYRNSTWEIDRQYDITVFITPVRNDLLTVLQIPHAYACHSTSRDMSDYQRISCIKFCYVALKIIRKINAIWAIKNQTIVYVSR